MAGKTKRAALVLTEGQKMMLKELTRSRTAPAREIERAKVLLGYADGILIAGLQRQNGQPSDDIQVYRQGAGNRCADGIEGYLPSSARTRD